MLFFGVFDHFNRFWLNFAFLAQIHKKRQKTAKKGGVFLMILLRRLSPNPFQQSLLSFKMNQHPT